MPYFSAPPYEWNFFLWRALLSRSTLRSEALNKANGLGTYQGTAALRVRSVALNEHYGVGTSIASSGSSFDWNQGIAGAAGVFAMVLVLAAAIVITRRRGGTPLGA